MEIDWERRRTNLRILMAVAGTKPTPLAEAAGLPGHTLTQFMSGGQRTLGEDKLVKLLPLLGLTATIDLDTDSILDDPKVDIRRIIDRVPPEKLPDLLKELQDRFVKPSDSDQQR